MSGPLDVGPCPWCGGMCEFHTDEKCRGCAMVICRTCMVSVDMVFSVLHAKFGEKGAGELDEDEMRAGIIERFNKRALPGSLH